MKIMLAALLATGGLMASNLVYAASCTDLARDLYSAQGYQQRCDYTLKQTADLSAQFKQQKCDQSLSAADKNKLLNEVNSGLSQDFAASKNKSCDAGKKRFN